MSVGISGRVQRLRVEGYRSIRNIEVNLKDLNLITGLNGCGKSNLFNSLRIVRAAMQGRLAQTLAEEGGLDAALWAGQRQKGSIRLTLEVQCDPFEYTLELGVRPKSEFPLFEGDPQIKKETIKVSGNVLVERGTIFARLRDVEGNSVPVTDLLDTESIVGQMSDPERFPALFQIRHAISQWVFYHDFRTDADSVLRRPAVETYAPRLYDDGSNLAPTLFVIQAAGEFDRLSQILKDAFPGVGFEIGKSSIQLRTNGVGRPFRMAEFSDGTLKFLAVAAACFSKQTAPLVAFNEPESSISPTAMEPLADLIAHAAQYSQIWVTTHSEELARALQNRSACKPIRLVKVEGETTKDGFLNRKGWRSEEYE